MVSFYAKRARGLMVRFLAQRAIASPEPLEPAVISEFAAEGYRYCPEASTPAAPRFRRAAKDRPSG